MGRYVWVRTNIVPKVKIISRWRPRQPYQAKKKQFLHGFSTSLPFDHVPLSLTPPPTHSQPTLLSSPTTNPPRPPSYFFISFIHSFPTSSHPLLFSSRCDAMRCPMPSMGVLVSIHLFSLFSFCQSFASVQRRHEYFLGTSRCLSDVIDWPTDRQRGTGTTGLGRITDRVPSPSSISTALSLSHTPRKEYIKICMWSYAERTTREERETTTDRDSIKTPIVAITITIIPWATHTHTHTPENIQGRKKAKCAWTASKKVEDHYKKRRAMAQEQGQGQGKGRTR
jgi:hypothetical protein